MTIYKTTNKINGKIYIGKNATDDPDYLGSGQYLKRAIKKYGRQHFIKETLETCSDEKALDERERYWIAFYRSTNREIGYNLTDGGTGGDTFKHKGEEVRKAQHDRLKAGARAWAKTEEGKKIMSENAKRMWADPAHVEHLRKVMTGRKITWGDKMSAALKKHYETHDGKPMSEERKKEQSIIMTGWEFKGVSQENVERIVIMYETMGPRAMEAVFAAEGIDLSQYLITRTLKKIGIYRKWQKGLKGMKKREAREKRLNSTPIMKYISPRNGSYVVRVPSTKKIRCKTLSEAFKTRGHLCAQTSQPTHEIVT